MFAAGMPAQAGMVTTGQLQKTAALAEFGNVAGQRHWVEAQLLPCGVAQPEAGARVAAMNDAAVAQIYRRVDEVPAGGNILLLEVIGYIGVISKKNKAASCRA